MTSEFDFTSGIPALDDLLQDVIEGDNIVFQVDKIEDYELFVQEFGLNARMLDNHLIYFRFAQHNCILPEEMCSDSIHIVDLNPEMGFEFFISQIINTIEKFGFGTCYVFDCLSDLAVDWYSDVMLGNLFMLVCPYLYDYKTVTYFALYRHYHDQQTFDNIHNTAQVVLDVYNHNDEIYIHPIKVENRFSPTLFKLHKWETPGSSFSIFKTIKESSAIAEVLTQKHYQWLNYSKEFSDAWHLSFEKAQETLRGLLLGEISLNQAESFKNKLLQSAIVQDDLILILAMQYFDLEDLLEIRKRMIGSGFIGGKSVGMLIAQSILKKSDPKWKKKLEVQDSFYIGSEVYYTYLVTNKCWWMRRKLSNPETFLEGCSETREKIIGGIFPVYILQQFKDMLNYFGQSPIIVRSSSLQEDAYGHAFAGKYESIFLANQGTPEERMENFLNAVRRVYASTVDKDALVYRKTRNLLSQDEQMAILVQRVSGSSYGDFFMPQAAGVGFSYNPFVWDKKIDPESGFLRLVLGLGTRAVDRTDDDYTRLIPLNVPNLRPEKDSDEIRQFSQWKLDLLDLRKNKLISKNFQDTHLESSEFPLDIYASRDEQLELRMEKLNRTDVFSYVLTFNYLLKNTEFVKDMKEILKTLSNAYVHPVDIEFTVNFHDKQKYKINLLQCRPFQVKTESSEIEIPDEIEKDKTIIKSTGPIIGNSISSEIDTIIYIVPQEYSKLSIEDRYSVARLIGKLNFKFYKEQKKYILIGAGRIGSSSPHLGIPVTFAEINNALCLGEIAEMHDNLIPDISLGTHFFNDLVEKEIIYFALNPAVSENILNREFFQNNENLLKNVAPESVKLEKVIKIINFKNTREDFSLCLYMNSVKQVGYIYFKNNH